MEMKQQNNCKITALFTIVDYSLGSKLTGLFKKMEIPINLIAHGHGAANSEIFDILGFGESKKAVAFSILTEAMAQQIFQELRSEMNFKKPGTGIAFTVQINAFSSVLSKLCISSNNKMNCKWEVDTMTQNEPYALILTIVNTGYFSEVMDVAVAAGATGGTLIHARGLGTEEATKFLGITIQPEKDIVIILVPQAKKQTIMESITKEVGLSSAGKGICFSLPVSAALGLGTRI